MTLPFEKNQQGAQNSISMSQVNVELFFGPTAPISLNQITVRNLLQKPDNQTTISLWDGFGKSNITPLKNPIFSNYTPASIKLSWDPPGGVCNKITITVKDSTDTTTVIASQIFTVPLALTTNFNNLASGTAYKVHLLSENTASTPIPSAESIITLLVPDLIPDPASGSITTVTGVDPSSTNVESAVTTIGGFNISFHPNISISASGNGSFQVGTSTLTSGWVTSATVIPDSNGNIVFQARMNASTSETTTLTSSYTIGEGSRTYSVTTRNPNPPFGPSASGGIGIATISWTYNPLYTYTVTADTGQTKTGITSGSVVLGDLSANNPRLSGTRTFYIYATTSLNGTSLPSSAVATVTPMPVITHSVSVSPATESSTFAFAASVANGVAGTTYSWQITGISAADISAMAVTTASGVTIITTALTGTAVNTSGAAVVVGLSMNPDYIMEGNETATFSIVGSPVADFANSSVSVVIQDTTVSRNTTWFTGSVFATSYVTSPITTWNYNRNTSDVYQTVASTSAYTSWVTSYNTYDGWNTSINTSWNTTY